MGPLLAELGVVHAALDFDALALDALFVDDAARRHRLPAANRVVSWFGARDAVFVRRLRVLVPGAIVAASTGHGPVWRHLLETVAALPGQWQTPIDVPPALVPAGERSLRDAGWDGATPLVVAHVGASGVSKRWPAEAFAAALARPDVAVVLHAGPLDDAAAAAVAARLPSASILHRPPLPVLAGALRHAAAFVGNDSGVSHLAAAVGAPSVIVAAERHADWVPWSASAVTLAGALDAERADDVARVRDALAAALARRRAA